MKIVIKDLENGDVIYRGESKEEARKAFDEYTKCIDCGEWYDWITIDGVPAMYRDLRV